MGTIVAMIGGFGAAMALFGALMALFAGGVGFSAGADEAGAMAARGTGAVFASLVGITGAFVARARMRTGGAMLLISAALGLLLVLWFYAVGAILLATAGVMAFWTGPDTEQERLK